MERASCLRLHCSACSAQAIPEALLVVVVAAIEVVVVAGRVVERRELVGMHAVDSIGESLRRRPSR